MMKQKNRNPLLLLALLLLAALLFTGCGQDEADEETETSQADQQEPSSVEFFAMDTYMTLSAYGDDAQAVLEKGQSLITSLEDKLSAEKKGSQIAKLNKNRKIRRSLRKILRLTAPILKRRKMYRKKHGKKPLFRQTSLKSPLISRKHFIRIGSEMRGCLLFRI